MIEPTFAKPVQINATQLAWLQEIGIDKRLLARFRAPEKAAADVRSRSATAVPAAAPAHDAVPAPVLASRPDQTPRGVEAAPPVVAARTSPGKAAPAGLTSAAKLLKDAPSSAPVPQDWMALEAHVAACQACSLFGGRSQTVFGAGPTESVDWMVIGEAPGEQDDRLGIPFQGKAGELLRAMLGCIGLGPESSVFYTNLIKCRPRGNRTPSPAEIASCLPYLQRQIALLKPRRILALGRVAALALLGEESDFEQLRGTAHLFRSEAGTQIPVIVTYHPASLLSRSQHKANAWRDLNLAVRPFPDQS